MPSQQVETSVAPEPARPPRAAARQKPALHPGFWLPVGTLLWREIVRFYRQPSRVVGALGTPIIVWLFAGAGFGGSFRAAARGANSTTYLEYLFPGAILLVVLFTSIFSTISVIEDRHEGFLLSVLVAPIPRAALVMGKVLGGAVLSLVQGLIFLALAPLVGVRLGMGQALQTIALLFLISFALTALGFYFAWRLDSVQGFHSVMNLVLLPMWLLSGAMFPVSGAHSWIGWVMRINPLTYGMAAVRRVLYPAQAADAPSLALSVGVMVAFGLIAGLADLREVRKPA